MRIAEKTAVILAIVSLLFKAAMDAGGSLLLSLSMLTLALIYFFFGFALFNDISFRDIFRKTSYQAAPRWHITLAIATGIALAVSSIAILFKLLLWPGSSIVLAVGIILCLPVLIVSIIKIGRRHLPYYRGLLTRVSIIGGICLVLSLLSDRQVTHLIYFRYPAYLNALDSVRTHPENRVFKDRLEAEQQKIRTH